LPAIKSQNFDFNNDLFTILSKRNKEIQKGGVGTIKNYKNIILRPKGEEAKEEEDFINPQ